MTFLDRGRITSGGQKQGRAKRGSDAAVATQEPNRIDFKFRCSFECEDDVLTVAGGAEHRQGVSSPSEPSALASENFLVAVIVGDASHHGWVGIEANRTKWWSIVFESPDQLFREMKGFRSRASVSTSEKLAIIGESSSNDFGNVRNGFGLVLSLLDCRVRHGKSGPDGLQKLSGAGCMGRSAHVSQV